jgi:ribosomal protein S18 acetylase RimI-like enzyme
MALLTAAQDWARKAGVSRLDLSVRADNSRAIRLYERAGFTREFTRKGFVRLPDGTLIDDHGYVKFLA